jgi:hypothetical protein
MHTLTKEDENGRPPSGVLTRGMRPRLASEGGHGPLIRYQSAQLLWIVALF